MAFIWNPNPTPPPPIVPKSVPPGEVSYDVALVANNVNYGGVLRYNTANKAFDIIYEFPTLNVTRGVFENGFFETANIGNAFINVADISQATLNTANITNATITFGYVTGSPTSNMGIASKFYVDNATAALSSGSGADNTSNIFTTAGDLLVGFAPNTAHRLGVGSDGQVLSVFSSSSVKQSWLSAGGSQSGRGVRMGTHHHPSKKLFQVLLIHADGIFMNDGAYVTGWDNVVADITITGAGGLDSNSVESSSAWYEVYAIRNSTSGAKALLLHRMISRDLDAHWLATLTHITMLRAGNAGLSAQEDRYIEKVSQSFVATHTGSLATVDLYLERQGNPVGDMWVSLQNDDGVGNATGSPLCTSVLVASKTLPTAGIVRFVFDTTTNLTTGNRYHLVAEGDWPYRATTTDANTVAIRGNTAPLDPGQQIWMANVGYTSGNLTLGSGYGDCRIWNVYTSQWMTAANTIGLAGPSDLYFSINAEQNRTSLSLPSGYNQYSLISYVRNNSSSNFKEYQQHNRTLSMGHENDWLVYQQGAAPAGIMPFDLIEGCPPIPLSVRLRCLPQHAFSAIGMGYSTAFDIQPFSTTDVSTRGLLTYTATDQKLGYSNIISVDGWNYLNVYAVAGGDQFVYVSSFTF